MGSVADFLELSAAEAALVELKLTLGRTLRERRTERGLTQAELARQLQSSQSRVAKMEAADASVSVDLLVRSLLVLGATAEELHCRLTGSRGFSGHHGWPEGDR